MRRQSSSSSSSHCSSEADRRRRLRRRNRNPLRRPDRCQGQRCRAQARERADPARVAQGQARRRNWFRGRHGHRQREAGRALVVDPGRHIRRLRRNFSFRLCPLRLRLRATISSRISTSTKRATPSSLASIHLPTVDTIASFATFYLHCDFGPAFAQTALPVRDTVDIQFIF